MKASFEELYAEALRLTTVDLPQAAIAARRVRRLVKQTGDERHLGLAERVLGHVALLRSRHRDALAHYEASVACLDRAGLAFEAAVTRSGATAALIYLADYDRLADWAHTARREFEARNDRARLARLDGNLALALFRQDRFVEALEIYSRLHHEFSDVGRPVDVANVLWNKATCLISLGDYAAASRAYAEAKDFARQHNMPVQLAAVDYNVAYLHYLCGDYTDAMHLYDAARKTGEPYRRALCDLDEAEMYLELNLHHEAGQFARRAIRQFQRLAMPYEQGKAAAFLAIAESQLGRSRSAIRSIASARRTFQRERNEVWLALLDLYEAILLDRAGATARAQPYAARALAWFKESAFPAKALTCELLMARLDLRLGHWQSAYERCRLVKPRVSDVGSPSLEFQFAQLEAEILESSGRYSEARTAYLAACAILERLRYRLRGDEIKVAFLKDKLTVYDRLFWLTLARHDDTSRVQTAFALAERAKSRSMAESIQFPSASASEVNELNDLRLGLEVTYQQIHRLEQARQPSAASATPQPGPLPTLRTEARRQETRLASRLVALNALRGHPASSPGGADGPPPSDWLPPQTQLIEYFTSRGTIFAFLAGRGRLGCWPLAPERRVARTIRFLRFQLGLASPTPGAIDAHLRQLYSDLFLPLRSELTADHLVIVPHGLLHAVPFAALHDGDACLLDRYAISYSPSAELLRLCAQRPAGRARRSVIAGVADELAPAIEREVRLLASLLPEPTLLTGSAANLASVRQEAATARFLHIAAHGRFHRGNPMFSSVRLADSWLTAFDLHRFEIPADLVTLSGCGTGLTEVVAADELLGLVRGLIQAGARAAVLSHWHAHDESTTELMVRMYQYLVKDGLPPVHALRRASLDIRTTYPDVRQWAAFFLIGMGGD
ncbi:MAG: CHAT domain-containing protein [Bryobacteraceae bacterium]|nr:CHAT domain-containing protein [Bryobacteraceae bacterium]